VWRPDALRGFFLKGMDDPDLLTDLHRIDRAVRLTLVPRIRLAIPAFSPRAAMAKASVTRSCASRGNSSNAFRAALTHERVRIGVSMRK